MLQALAGGIQKVDVNGGTLQDCLDALVKLYPVLRAKIFRNKHQLSNGIEIYLNREKIHSDPLKKTIKNGDTIHISFVILGG